MSWFIIALVIPVVVAWRDGSTYAFSLSVAGTGIFLYFANIFLIRTYISKRAPKTLIDDSWESTAGTGTVPRWVSSLGMLGVGLALSGVIVSILLWFGMITNRAG